MKIIRSARAMQKLALLLKKKKKLAVVPTMGFLHDGHLSLVKKAKSIADIVIVTIFVNPMQFGQNEDLSKYPRDERGDLAKLKTAKTDYVFIPKNTDMYPDDFQTSVTVKRISKPLCGQFRPTHFEGVATIVTKLFCITQPDIAVFGKKDYQQFRLIQQLIQDLNLPIKLIGAPTQREKSGLALSSRNSYLSSENKTKAAQIYQALRAVKNACQNGLTDIEAAKKMFGSELDQTAFAIQYAECLDRNTLAELPRIALGKTVMAVAVYLAGTRLIDNIEI